MAEIYIPAAAIQANFKPDFPVEIDSTSPTANGLVKVFAAISDAKAIGGVTPLIGTSGRAFRATSSTAYYRASPTKILSGQATWSVMAVFSTVQVSSSSVFGRAIYCERAPSGNDILTLGGIANNSASQAQLTIRDDAGSLIQINAGPAINDGKVHVLHAVRYSATDHRLFLDGIQIGSSTTSVSATYTAAIESRIGSDTGYAAGIWPDPIYAVGLWNRPLSATEIQQLAKNPYQILRPKQRDLYLAYSSGTVNVPINPGVGSVGITGYAPSISQPQALSPTVGSIGITGYAPTIAQPQSVSPSAGSVSITGYAPALSQTANQALTPNVGSIAVTGYAPALAQTANQGIAPNVGTLSITGYPPAITQASAASINPGVGSVAITGYAPTISTTANQAITPNAGSISITGYQPTISQPHSITAGTGSLSVTGYAPTITQAAGQQVNPANGAISITGFAPSITQSANAYLTAGTGALSITGYAPIVAQSVNKAISLVAGSIGITGYAPTISVSGSLISNPTQWRIEASGRKWAINATGRTWQI